MILALFLFAGISAHATVPNVRDLSIEDLAGQVFMIAIDTDIAAARESDIRAGRLGGALLRWDLFTAEEARAFSKKMHAWTQDSPRHIPFWLAADHEGGALFTQRRFAIAPFPGNMALGAADSGIFAHDAALAVARALKSIGVQLDFAPDLDVNSNPSNPIIGLRSFGEDPRSVARLGRAAVKGYRKGGVIATIKHFPGHGDTLDDSHLGLPVSTKTLAELDETELVPFREAIFAGAEAVMPAHMVFPALGTARDEPVTLSSAAIAGFLRGRMGFKGLVFSDSLDMGAIANVYGSSQAAVLSLLAGNDVLLLGKGDYPASFAAVVDAVKGGRLPRARLEASVSRILRAKKRLGLFGDDWLPPPLSPKDSREAQALARRIAESAVTLVRNDGTIPLKLPPERTLGLVVFHSPRFSGEAEHFAAEIAQRHPRTEFVDIPSVTSRRSRRAPRPWTRPSRACAQRPS
jgi:beta-N-acetylhexosaminidase